ncbi:MAG: dihydropteroate synthase [Puniceicoccales bacterium]|jgi:dihydropteroate synthase|nr:dihydropteroate synthase [Puniceicoccales bacterium]
MIAEHPVIMGILNLTPDSFFDGGCYETVDAAVERAKKMLAEGAEIIDIGGESTRPGFTPIDAETEWLRIGDVLKKVSKLGVKISVDTYKPVVAKRALEHGATIVNDVYAFEHLDEAISLAKYFGAELVVTHNSRNRLLSRDIIANVREDFQRAISEANKHNFDTKNLILDVGIGFVGTPVNDIEIISRLGELTNEFQERVLIGTSRKSFMKIFGEPTAAERLPCTLAATMVAYLGGCAIFRVHDVKANLDVLNFAKAMYGRRYFP